MISNIPSAMLMGAFCSLAYAILLKYNLVLWRDGFFDENTKTQKYTVGSLLFSLFVLSIPAVNISIIISLLITSIILGKFTISRKIKDFIDTEIFK
jgi:hypothetical protein